MSSRPRLVIPSETYGLCFALILFCGLAMLASFRPGGRIADFSEAAWRPSISLFFFVNAFLLTLLATTLGSRAAASPHPHRMLRVAAVTLLMAESLLVPFLVFLTATINGGVGRVFLLTAYVLSLTETWSLVAWRITARQSRPSRALAGKLVSLLAYILIPLAFRFAPAGLRLASMLGPIDAIGELAGTPSAKTAVLAFSPIIVLLVVSLISLANHSRGRIHA